MRRLVPPMNRRINTHSANALLRAGGCLILWASLLAMPAGGASAAESGLTQFWQDLQTLGRAMSGEGEADIEPEVEPKPEPIPLFVTPPDSSKTMRRPKPVPAVAEAQRWLNLLGYDAGPSDGLSGRQTRAALRTFQRDQGLEVNGRLNAKTRAVLTELASNASQGAISRPKSTRSRTAERSSRAISAGAEVRSFEFRDISLGDSVDQVRTVFDGIVVRTETKSATSAPQVESYFGVDYQAGVSFRFDREGALYRLNSTQVLDRSVTPRKVYERFVEKYGPANDLSEFRDDGQQGRFRWSTLEPVGEATLEVTVYASVADNLTRIHATLRDESTVVENRSASFRAARDNARNRPVAGDVNL